MLLDFIFPRTCAWCWKKWDYLCQECKKELYAHPEICPFCHQKSSDFKVCKSCSENQVLKWIIIWFAYKWVAKKLILKAKFAHKKDVISFLAQRLTLLVYTNQQLKSKFEYNQLFISYIPSHWRRQYYEKWYNQSELLAKSLANELWIPMLKLASKKSYTISQLHLNREERKKNLKWVFHIEDLSKLPNWSTVLLIDDVTTTGSTLSELAKTIHSERSDLDFRWAVIARNMWYFLVIDTIKK
jgi:ComF family protein